MNLQVRYYSSLLNYIGVMHTCNFLPAKVRCLHFWFVHSSYDFECFNDWLFRCWWCIEKMVLILEQCTLYYPSCTCVLQLLNVHMYINFKLYMCTLISECKYLHECWWESIGLPWAVKTMTPIFKHIYTRIWNSILFRAFLHLHNQWKICKTCSLRMIHVDIHIVHMYINLIFYICTSTS